MAVKFPVKTSKTAVSHQPASLPISARDDTATSTLATQDESPKTKAASGSAASAAKSAGKEPESESSSSVDAKMAAQTREKRAQTIASVQERVSRGESVPTKDVATASEDVVKRLTGHREEGAKQGSTQRETVSSLPSGLSNLERSPQKSKSSGTKSASDSGRRQPARSQSNQRSSSHRSGMAVVSSQAEGSTSRASSPDRFDFVSEYGLFLLRPEIITLYDSDPEVDQTGKTTAAFDFANLQQATAKALQEKSYKPTRQLLSSIVSNPAIPFEKSDLESLNHTSAIETSDTSVFEQAVARWDSEKKRVVAMEDEAAKNAVIAQSLATALDIVNSPESFSDTISGEVSLRDVIKKAVENVKANPTADPLLVAGRYYNRHDFLHKVESASSWVENLLHTAEPPPPPDMSSPLPTGGDTPPRAETSRSTGGFAGSGASAPASSASQISGEKSLDFTTYSFMHALLQNAFFSFAFGSQRTNVGRDTTVRTKSTSLNSAYIYKISNGREGKIASNQMFIRSTTLPEDAAESSQFGSGIAEALFVKLSSLAAYRSSHLYDGEKTAIEVFQERIGLPVSFYTRDSSGSAITDFEQADAGTVVNQLFQVSDSADSKKIIFFDRNRNPGLPSSYTQGYSKIFGTGGEAASASSDLVSRINASLASIDEISNSLLAGSIGDRKASEAGAILLERFSELLKPISQDTVTGYADFHINFGNREYTQFLDLYAGTGFSSNNTIPVHPYTSVEQALGDITDITVLVSEAKSINVAAADHNNLNSFPVFSTLEYLMFLTNVSGSAIEGDAAYNLRYLGSVEAEYFLKLTLLLQEKYTLYWRQYLDFRIGGRDEVTIKLDDNFVNDLRKAAGFYDNDHMGTVTRLFYGFWTKLDEIAKFAEPCIKRIVDWSIETAQLMFPNEFSLPGNNKADAKVSALFEFSRQVTTGVETSRSYTITDICYFITVFASYYAKGIFTQPRMPGSLDRRNFSIDSDAYKKTNEIGGGSWDSYYLITEFKTTANTYINSFASQVQTSFDDARLGLEVVAEQLKAVRSGLESVAASDSPLLESGKFNMLFTPMQAAGITLRKAEFLERSARSPFQSWRYDELLSIRSLERSAINALYRSDLMRQDDTKVLFVGLPTGIQHSVGINQHYVKITVTRKDAGFDTEYEPLVFYFDMFKFCSPELCVAARTVPWSVKTTGNIEEAVSKLKMFKIDLQGNRTYGNFSLADQSTSVSARDRGMVDVKHITRPNYYANAGTSAGNVLVSDLTVTCELLGSRAAASDTGTTPDLIRVSQKIDGNHLVDTLLKTHVKRMSGLDLTEPVFTTSSDGFRSTTTGGLNDIGQYVFDLCATSIVGTKKDNPAAAAFDIKMLEIISRSPITRADSYADLCLKPTYFDRVFAMPVNLRQFKLK